jgi:hypothetical protein
MSIVERLGKIVAGAGGCVGARKIISKRKNLSNVHGILVEAFAKKYFSPGDFITSSMIVEAIGPKIAAEWFRRDNGRADENGPSKSIGDLLGGHGLQLRLHKRGIYVFPNKLPVVENDCMYVLAVYND